MPFHIINLFLMMPLLAMQVLQPLYGEEDTLSKGIRVVRSLFDHRRQDVREAAAREAAEREAREEEKLPSFTRETYDVDTEKQLKLLENMLTTRIGSEGNFKAGTTVNRVIKAIVDRAKEAGTPVDVSWEGESEDNAQIRLRDDVLLSGCNLAEALHRICAAADCEYVVREGQIVLKYVGDAPITMSLLYYKFVVNGCFIMQRADGTRVAHLDRDVWNDSIATIKAKRWGAQLNRRISGKYNEYRCILTLKSTPYTLLRCKRDLDTLYTQWLGSGEAEKNVADHTRDRRWRMEQKLESALAVPVEFPRTTTVKDVVKYFTLVCRYAKLKANVKFKAEREDLEMPLPRPLKIGTCTILEALFCACDSMKGSYKLRLPWITFTPEVLETRRYAVNSALQRQLREEENKNNGRNGSSRQSSSVSEVTDIAAKTALRAFEIHLPFNGSASYDVSDKTITVEADPRSIHRLNRYLKLAGVVDNP